MESAHLPVATYDFTVEEYHKMLEAGILREDDRVELVEGKLIKMSPILSPHAACVDRLGDLLNALLEQQVIVRRQNPILLGKHSEPEPDLAIAKFQADYYEKKHPEPEDLLFVVEIADSSERYDRAIKMPLYAKHGITEAWLVSSNQKTVEVYQNPEPEGYATMHISRKGDMVQSDFLQQLAVHQFLS